MYICLEIVIQCLLSTSVICGLLASMRYISDHVNLLCVRKMFAFFL